MLDLPPVAPVTGWRLSTRLARDYYVRVDANDYSVDLAVIGRTVEVAAGLEEVTVTCGGRQVARHLRCWPPTRASPIQLTQPQRRSCGRAAG